MNYINTSPSHSLPSWCNTEAEIKRFEMSLYGIDLLTSKISLPNSCVQAIQDSNSLIKDKIQGFLRVSSLLMEDKVFSFLTLPSQHNRHIHELCLFQLIYNIESYNIEVVSIKELLIQGLPITPSNMRVCKIINQCQSPDQLLDFFNSRYCDDYWANLSDNF